MNNNYFDMEQKKYKHGIVILLNGERIKVTAPQGRLTKEYFERSAPHWARVEKSMVQSVQLID